MLALLLACARETYDVADLQLDVEAELPDASELIHVCVQGQGEHTEGAGNGRIAVPALRMDQAPVVTVEVWDDADQVLGVAGPVELLNAYTTVAFTLGSASSCTAEGAFARDDEASQLLALRFLGEEP